MLFEKNKKRNLSASNEKESINDFDENKQSNKKSQSSKEKRVNSSEIFKESTEKINKMN